MRDAQNERASPYRIGKKKKGAYSRDEFAFELRGGVRSRRATALMRVYAFRT